MFLLSILASAPLVVGVLHPFIAHENFAEQHVFRSLSSSQSAQDLQKSYEAAHAMEAANWLANVSTDPFYQSPANISAYAPGQAVRLESVPYAALDHIFPPGLSLYRMLYQSLDLEDKPVPASAFILLPYARSQPHAPLRVIVWTHGTSGIERQCAPSNQRDLFYGYDGPYAMALRGYAVVAPDYAGLGSDTQFNYLASPSHAADAAFSVIAARHAFPGDLLTYEWVAVGHSEGGLTAWAINEREVTQPIGGFLGSVALAPALQNLHIIRHGLEGHKLGNSLFYSSYQLAVIARLDKSVDVMQYFSDLGWERTQLAATGCYFTAAAVFANLTFSDIFKDPTWLDSPWALAWEKRTTVSGERSLAQPLLLVEGLGETAVFPAIPEAVFAHHCEAHRDTRVHLSRYPEMDHDPVAYVSQLEYFRWIDNRFNGVQVPYGCTNGTIDIITPEHMMEHRLVSQT
ncbi:hypothetical protein JB92DRAFT_2696291 [Gautieria morchelliformis]|nr:hypothetical protein JB92DRAFT_2696291 [Gautieria morchelliformis]